MDQDPFARIIGRSAAAESIRAFGRRAAAVDAPVLLLGESGTGKGVLARAIHDASPRARKQFVAVNCAAIPESLFESEFFGHVRGAFTGAQYAHKGLFEQADGGTLFLDEIGELPLTAQAKLLTVIEDLQIRRLGGERTSVVNLRLIGATAVDLVDAVSQRRFRNDLFHRLSVLHFTIPPLRQRHGDIELLAEIFLARAEERYGKRGTLSERARAQLESAPWHGNIRELSHALESALLNSTSHEITELAVSDYPTRTLVVEGRKQRYSFAGDAHDEKRTIEIALQRCGGNKTRAAAELGMSRNTLLYKLRRMSEGQLWLILLFILQSARTHISACGFICAAQFCTDHSDVKFTSCVVTSI